ncbi:hypothetical protein GCM10010191_74920 [Actinomadura vinacea]|uniref:DUF397 domain-containing protein n=1 Tax=Actinomadura vinacea TaxID=115336 RepID=A0ABN3K4Q2_9ACTN
MTRWRKSSHSGGSNGGMSDCVEVAAFPEGIGVRDSKAPDTGHLILTPETFAALLTCVKHDDLPI